MSERPTPFCKWAGGKGQLLDRLRDRQPASYGSYYEPFVGAGAVLFGFEPQVAHVNDVNAQLINTYIAIRDDLDALMHKLDELDGGFGDDPKAYYCEVRQKYNDKLVAGENDTELAALFIFLNKHCFNGLYRVNAKGRFNVPYNNSTRASYDAVNLRAVSEYLQGVDIHCGDFEEACEAAQPGDFVFFDSPYAPLNDTSFEAYTKEGFVKEDHERLAMVFRRLDKRGCYCMLTNHNTDFINELYEGYTIEAVPVKRMINSDASKRTGEEVIIRNYA